MSTIKIKYTCPVCKQEYTIEADKERYAQYQSGTMLQVAFSDKKPIERDAIVGRCCMPCFSKMYNEPLPGEEDKFGERIGECSCCGQAVWSKDIVDGSFTCRACGQNEYDAY